MLKTITAGLLALCAAMTPAHAADIGVNKFKDSENSWTVDAKSIDKTTYELSVKNPNKVDETEFRDPKDIIAEMAALDAESAEILAGIGRML